MSQNTPFHLSFSVLSVSSVVKNPHQPLPLLTNSQTTTHLKLNP